MKSPLQQIEGAMELAEATIENLQSIGAIQTEVANMLFQANVDNAKAFVWANTPQQAMASRTQYTRKMIEVLVKTAREISEIGNTSRLEFSRLLTEKPPSGISEMMQSFQTFFGTLPGNDTNEYAMNCSFSGQDGGIGIRSNKRAAGPGRPNR